MSKIYIKPIQTRYRDSSPALLKKYPGTLSPSRIVQERNGTIGELLLGRIHGDGTTVGTSSIKGGSPAHY